MRNTVRVLLGNTVRELEKFSIGVSYWSSGYSPYQLISSVRKALEDLKLASTSQNG